MAPASASVPVKVLRLGVIHDGRIVEERLVRRREPVIVGGLAKSTLVLPASAAVGSAFKLFDLDGVGYSLAFTDTMRGQVSVDDNVLELQHLRSRGLAKKRGALYCLPLADNARGKIVLGDVTIVFQFVVPPPLPLNTKLPAELGNIFAYGVDWPFAGIIVGVASLFFAFVLALRSVPIPAEITLAQIDDRFARLLVPKLREQKEEPAVEAAQQQEPQKKKEEKKAEPAQEELTKEQLAARKREIQQKVAGKGILAILGAKGARGSAVADVFGEGKALSGDIESAFQGIAGVDIASGGNTTSRGNAGSGSSATIGAMATTGAAGAKASLDEKAEHRVASTVQASPPDVDGGSLDPQAIARVVKGRLSAVKECYERELKRHPKLSGKVIVRFSVDEEGRVTNAAVEEDTLGESSVGRCIVERFERFRFPKPDGGVVTVSYPFIFTPTF